MTASPPAPAAPTGVTLVTPPAPPLPPVSGVVVVAPPTEAGAPAKPGSARDGMMSRLRAKAGEGSGNDRPAAPTAPAAAAPAAPAAPAAAAPEAAAAPTDAEIAAAVAAAKPEVDDKGKAKVNPWKLVEQYKKTAAQREQELAEFKKAGVDPEVRKSEVTKYAELEKRAKELEDHIRFVDYSKSAEFKEKYQAPYEKAWGRAMSELKELTIPDPDTGAEREVAPTDILRLVNLPLKEARDLAEEVFGSAANDVMIHRKEIKQLFEAKAQALEEAKTSGSERVKQMTAQQQQQATELSKVTSEAWERANQELVADPKIAHIFKAADGDEAGKTSLEKGYKFVDDAFKVNPMDPRLTNEQRLDAVKRQAAVRQRAAAFGHQRILAERLQARLAVVEKELADYKGTTPNFEPGRTTQEPTANGGNRMDAMMSRLAKYVKPG